jgi:hypothetical protein
VTRQQGEEQPHKYSKSDICLKIHEEALNEVLPSQASSNPNLLHGSAESLTICIFIVSFILYGVSFGNTTTNVPLGNT